MTMAPERPSSPPAAADTAAAQVPRRADGVELIGEYEGSGFKEAPSLVRRSDGQVIQLPPLLYSLVAKVDGHRNYQQIAGEVSDDIKRGLDADNVRFLVEEKLRPLGILCAADGSSPALEKPDPFLGLKLRAAVIPEATSGSLGSMFKPLFFPLLVLGVLAAFAVTDWWLFGIHGVAQSVRQSIYHPGLFLPLFAAIVLSAAFHEIGHAAGCRYGGGNPGKMGCGLYLAWPAFYTDVTDAYRLGKRSRLRTDLGGVYFNVVVVLVTMAAYVVTGFEPLLLLIVVQHFEIVHQLLPIVRLDGYYIVADITGVPDLFARIGPILRSLIPGRKADERVTVLKPWVRAAVTAWVLVVVPLLVFELFVLLVHLPRILGTAWDSGFKMFRSAQHAFGSGNALSGVSSGLQLVVLAIPIVGILLVIVRSATGGGRWVWRHTDGRPLLRALTVGTVGTGMALLAYAWLSPHNYTPIRPGEKGTLIQSVKAVKSLPDLPKEERPETPSASTTTVPETTATTTNPESETTLPRATTTVAPRRSSGGDEPATATTVASPTTTEPANPTTTVGRAATTVP
jgi:putative peptide zinc metalloprotease protein